MPDENLLIYLNLNGELFYIISHRMNSQAVQIDLQKTVFNDLASAIFNPKAIQDIVLGKVKWINMTYSEIKCLMDRIVHSSIMTVNQYSMDKLFELTLIASKYQYSVCQFPKDILLIALNHIDSIKKVLTDAYALQLSINLHYILVDGFANISGGIMQEYRYSILTYLSEVNLKMTNLIRLGLQKPTGEFIKTLAETEIPEDCVKAGSMELYDYKQASDIKKSSTHIIQFDTTNLSSKLRPKASLDLNGDRQIILGLSIYESDYPVLLKMKETEIREQMNKNLNRHNFSLLNEFGPNKKSSNDKKEFDNVSIKSNEIEGMAVNSLNLLGMSLGCPVEDTSIECLDVNFSTFEMQSTADNKRAEICDEKIDQTECVSSDVNVIQIESRRKRSVFDAIAKDFDTDELLVDTSINKVDSLFDSMFLNCEDNDE